MRQRVNACAIVVTAGLLVSAMAAGDVWAQQAIILVRHAERVDQSSDSPLSAEGEARARRLAEMLAAEPVTHLIATHYQRTQATLAPLAKARGLSVNILRADDINALVARLRALGPADVAVYAGHSDSVPQLLKALGHPEDITIESSDYGNLFIVIPRPGAPPTVVRLRF